MRYQEGWSSSVILSDIIELSRLYGQNPDFVLAGGGNTSVKSNGALYVKASGHRLADIDEAGFVALDLKKLTAITEKAYPSDEASAEAAVLADMMAARIDGETGRPSVEALLHALFPQQFVVHLHPAMLNGLTCGKDGEGAVLCFLGFEAVWLDAVKPGYTLAMAAKKALDHAADDLGHFPSLLFLQNHGVFFAAETKEEMTALIDGTIEAIQPGISKVPSVQDDTADYANTPAVQAALQTLSKSGRHVLFFSNSSLRAQSVGWSTVTSCALTPDHVVYLSESFCCVSHAEDLSEALPHFQTAVGYSPKIVVLKGVGAFAIAAESDAQTYRMLFTDFIKINDYAKNFSGARLMPDELTAFIRNWEVERYRQNVLIQAERG